jgi:hypothetical protein
MKTIRIIAVLASFISFAMIEKNSVGIFENSVDVGNPKIKGSTVYDKKPALIH